MKERKKTLHFTGRRHAARGIIATVVAVVAWLIFAALCVYSAKTGGNAATVVGIIGILDAFLSLGGGIIAYYGFHESDVYYLMPGIGIVLNGILFVIYFSLYFMGMAIS